MVARQTADELDTRRVGQAAVTVIAEGTALWAPHFPVAEAEWRAALPEADAAGRIPVGLHALHITLGAASIVIDPGFDDPGRPGYVTPKLEEVRRAGGLAAGLARLGVRPEEVTHVVITHAHADHCGGVAVEQAGGLVPRFPQARHFIGRADWDEGRAPTLAGTPVAARLSLLARLGLLELVEAERAIAPGVTLLPAPGETPGHLLVRVESEGEIFYALGDLFHHGCEVAHPDWTPPGRDVTAALAARERLLAEAAADDALLTFAHERFPPWGRVVRTGDGYRWQRI
jgi:glyoxylase-like metal-dependent hydrolase (beta-lactamase superfamily II)